MIRRNQSVSKNYGWQTESGSAGIGKQGSFNMNGNNKDKLLPNTDTHNCFGCSPKNPHGLKMKFYCSENTVHSWVTVPKNLCGWNQNIHGGIISTILDEVMGWAGIYFLKKITLTKKITVEFKKAAYVGDELKASASVVKINGKREAVLEACIYNCKGELCAKADGTFTLISADVGKKLNIVNEEQVQTFFEPLINS
ncbi:MAG: PaaI family thioesterase [Desulfobacterales bacterium]|nr:PaaI family thioesterase [Desulfobacterales bacterium]